MFSVEGRGPHELKEGGVLEHAKGRLSRSLSQPYGRFPKSGVPFGVPMIRIVIFWGRRWGLSV